MIVKVNKTKQNKGNEMKLNNKLLSSIALAGVLMTGCSAASSTHWGYTGHEGPTNWGDLDPKYEMCKKGMNQAPINISKDVTIKTEGLKAIDFNYKTGASSVINNGHTIQVNVKDGSSIKVDGITFNLIQFHFHTPSENQIEGKHFPLEAHFVHASKDGELAVVAVLFEDGKENPIIKKIWNKMPHKAGGNATCGLSSKVVNDILPKNKEYYRFTGSLTTPPCSEGVRWLVLKNYSTISKAQAVEFLKTMHHKNNRPVLPINARKVMK